MFSKILFFIAAALILPVTVISQPKLESAGGNKLNFGDAIQGAKIERTIAIKNTGTSMLHIASVEAQCGCTATMMAKKELAPSESDNLTITFNTKGYNGKATKRVTIKSDDPANPTYTIEFEANVVTVLSMNPQYLSMYNAKSDTTYTQSVTITNTSKNPVKILSIETKVESAKTSLMKNQLGPGEQTVLQMTFHPTHIGTYNGTIEINTDHPSSPKMEVRFYGAVK